MDALLDTIWMYVEIAVQSAAHLLDQVLAPLAPLGPAAVIVVIAMSTVALTKLFGRLYQTKRHAELKRDFQHWYQLRQEALTCPDREKGKALARNIDQAKLNKAYYDYFFEGFMKSLLTRYLPILTMLAYVNEAFRPERLSAVYGRDHLFQWHLFSSEPVAINAPFWYFVAILFIYIFWAVATRLLKKRASRNMPAADFVPQTCRQ